MLVEGRHFLSTVAPERLGHKALAVNLSDLAACGASRWPSRWRWRCRVPTSDWLAGLARGLLALAERHGIELVGGDTTAGPLNLCITVMGQVPAGQALLRSGAKPGDELWVSGTLGDARLALEVFRGTAALAATTSSRAPRHGMPRAARGAGPGAARRGQQRHRRQRRPAGRPGPHPAALGRGRARGPGRAAAQHRAGGAAARAAARMPAARRRRLRAAVHRPARRRGRGAARGATRRRGGHAHRPIDRRTRPGGGGRTRPRSIPPRAASTTSHDGRHRRPARRPRAAPRRASWSATRRAGWRWASAAAVAQGTGHRGHAVGLGRLPGAGRLARRHAMGRADRAVRSPSAGGPARAARSTWAWPTRVPSCGTRWWRSGSCCGC
jgi:hypothetical protein